MRAKAPEGRSMSTISIAGRSRTCFPEDIGRKEPCGASVLSRNNDRDHRGLSFPRTYFKQSSPEKKGYSGTAIFARKEALSVSYGIGVEEHDHEGRVITLEYEGFYLVTVYTRGLRRTRRASSLRASLSKPGSPPPTAYGREALQARSSAGFLAPARGLFLRKVYY